MSKTIKPSTQFPMPSMNAQFEDVHIPDSSKDPMKDEITKIRMMIDQLERVPGHPNLRRQTCLPNIFNFILNYFVPKDQLLDILEEEIMKDPMRFHRIIDKSLREDRDKK